MQFTALEIPNPHANCYEIIFLNDSILGELMNSFTQPVGVREPLLKGEFSGLWSGTACNIAPVAPSSCYRRLPGRLRPRGIPVPHHDLSQELQHPRMKLET